MLTALYLGWFDASAVAELGVHRFHVMGIALFTAFSLLHVATQLYRPEERPGALLAAVVIILVATLVTVRFGGSLLLGAVLGGPALVALLLHPAGRSTFERAESDSPAMVGLFVVAAVPLVLFAAGQLHLQLTQPTADPHAEHSHYAFMGVLRFAFVVSALVAVVRIPGWRITAWLAGAGVTYFGIQSAFMTSQVGSVGRTWGALAVVWGVAFVAVAEYSRRDDVSWLVRRSPSVADDAAG